MKGYKFKLEPNETQKKQIQGTLDSARFVYNRFLDLNEYAYQTEGIHFSYLMMCSLLTDLKQDPEYPWLKQADSMALRSALKDLDEAFQNFFAGRAKYPKFKTKKHAYKSAYRTCNQNNVIQIIDKRHVKLPKLGIVRARISRFPHGVIKNATISLTATGKYEVSFCVDEIAVPKKSAGGEIAIDVGLAEFYTDSKGRVVENPHILAKLSRKLAREQRKLSRMREAAKKAGRLSECRNYQKQRIKVAKIHERIANARADFLQKQSTALADENQIIYAEHLNIRGMIKNHKLAKAILDASWNAFFQMLEYKTKERNGFLIKVDTFYPSSQICHECGYKNPAVKDLNVRKWICPQCGAVHDRDQNAALNILAEGIRIFNEPQAAVSVV